MSHHHHLNPPILCMNKEGNDDNDNDANGTNWLNDVDVTDRSVVLTLAAAVTGGDGGGDDILEEEEEEDPWNHLLMMDCSGDSNDDEDVLVSEDTDDFAASAKRVSLDVTETWMITTETTPTTTETAPSKHGCGSNDMIEHYDADVFASLMDYRGLESDPVLIQASMTAAATANGINVNEQHSNLLLLHNSNSDGDDPWRELQIDDEDMLLMDEDIQDHNNYYYYCNEHFKGDATTTTITSSSSREASEEDEEEDQSFTTTNGTFTTSIPSLFLSDFATGTSVPSSSSSSSYWEGGRQLLWHERRAQLAASIQASELSRQACYKTLNEHVQLRANLKRVLADIAHSTTAVQEQICGGGGGGGAPQQQQQQQKQPKAQPLFLPQPQLSTSHSSNDSTCAEEGGNDFNDSNEHQDEKHLLLSQKDSEQDADNYNQETQANNVQAV